MSAPCATDRCRLLKPARFDDALTRLAPARRQLPPPRRSARQHTFPRTAAPRQTASRSPADRGRAGAARFGSLAMRFHARVRRELGTALRLAPFPQGASQALCPPMTPHAGGRARGLLRARRASRRSTRTLAWCSSWAIAIRPRARAVTLTMRTSCRTCPAQMSAVIAAISTLSRSSDSAMAAGQAQVGGGQVRPQSSRSLVTFPALGAAATRAAPTELGQEPRASQGE